MRWIVAIVLLIAVTPGMTEVVEAAGHAIVHQDAPHHDEGAASSSDEGCGDEHSCNALFHACGCHVAMSAHVRREPTTASSVIHVSTERAARMADLSCRMTEPPPLRPPIR